MLKDQTVYSPSDLYASSSRSFAGKGASSPQAESSDNIAKVVTIATTIKIDFFIIFLRFYYTTGSCGFQEGILQCCAKATKFVDTPMTMCYPLCE